MPHSLEWIAQSSTKQGSLQHKLRYVPGRRFLSRIGWELCSSSHCCANSVLRNAPPAILFHSGIQISVVQTHSTGHSGFSLASWSRRISTYVCASMSEIWLSLFFLPLFDREVGWVCSTWRYRVVDTEVGSLKTMVLGLRAISRYIPWINTGERSAYSKHLRFVSLLKHYRYGWQVYIFSSVNVSSSTASTTLHLAEIPSYISCLSLNILIVHRSANSWNYGVLVFSDKY